jgi:hypothetical protein
LGHIRTSLDYLKYLCKDVFAMIEQTTCTCNIFLTYYYNCQQLANLYKKTLKEFHNHYFKENIITQKKDSQKV